MQESNAKRIQAALLAEIDRAPKAAPEVIARNVHSDYAELVTAWALDKLTLLADAQLRRMRGRAPDPYQMFLEGFGGLAARVPVEDRRVRLSSATIPDLRRGLRTARRHSREQEERLLNLIEAMRPYARTRRNLTVAGYCKLRAAGVASAEEKRMRQRRDEDDD